MSDKLKAYTRVDAPLPERNKLWPLYGAGFDKLGQDGCFIETEFPVYGPDELLVRHDAVGICFSSLAQSQLQAVQMTFFFFLPSILLSGFMFPFAGMPLWVRWLVSALPLTHFLRIVRGIMLKGNSVSLVLPHIWPILLFTLVVILIAMKVYRRTLD